MRQRVQVSNSRGSSEVLEAGLGHVRAMTRRAGRVPYRMAIAAWARRQGIAFDRPPVIALGTRFPKVDIPAGGRIEFGLSVRFAGRRAPTRLGVGPSGVLRIGDHSFLNDGANVFAQSRVHIGARVLIGDFVSILDTNFHEVEANAGVVTAPIDIGDNVWIGLGAIVLPGVTIGDGTVIAAGAVVVSSLPGGVLAAGNPAKVKRSLQIPEGWIRR